MPYRIPSSAPPLLIFLVFFLSLLISTNAYLVNSPPTRYCPNSTCGTHSFAYPLSIARNEFTIPSTFCGYPRLILICQDDTPILPLGSYKYRVTNIHYHNQTISLADTDLHAAGTCPRPHHNLTLMMDTVFLSNTSFRFYLNDTPYQSYLNYTSSDTNLTFFLNCSDGPPERRITCYPGSGDKEYSYVFTERDVSYMERVQECQDIVVVPVLDQDVNWGNLSALSSDFGSLLNRGFQLGWSNDTDETCDRCELSGGRCGYQFTKTSLEFTCFCSNRRADQHCDKWLAESRNVC
ncbi:LEAF RUST 10 DISEASE-RESISTANCE LOCUS RECEPTOR-LIKE PROTEIN KINASE-like 1.2 [Cocos nucifera]|uniref:LEAF RUST 10 DISEASE-RESISTANCE LOCUS RECEPTOR-LIKE PROTEIN KINASE-like 1.2 n=1 Tax=Cocos nucifera TaxID=13894 RepID=A0A8K0N3H7_COCNU|nr:LEAF RUST 10 DISEASE-RESISTANCE LOCUS RECEPTOR-LIKE PROTEIN KINASE-like 1.2 [Cocos nucifera]